MHGRWAFVTSEARMTPEPQRLAYLEAMGLTAWVARYQLPNARETEACDWPELEPEEAPARGADRLHALLDDSVASQGNTDASEPAAEPVERPESAGPSDPRGPRKARALLGDIVPDSGDSTSVVVPDTDMPMAEPAEALPFACLVGCIDGRWLVLVAQTDPMSVEQQRLLANILGAAGVHSEQRPVFEVLHWPLAEGLPVRQPLEEARQGLKAFVTGRGRRGWKPERVLMFGTDETLDRVVDEDDGKSCTLELPLWKGPSLASLLAGAEAKRTLWPQLENWKALWNQADAEPGSGAGESV